MPRLLLLTLTTALLVTSAAHATVTVHATDFIDDAQRTNFNGFEQVPFVEVFYTGGVGPYIEDGISVRQVPGDMSVEIAVDYPVSDLQGPREGLRSWYPAGGDHGYTAIRRADGSDFQDVGMLVGSGAGTSRRVAYYLLLNDGLAVAEGSVPHGTNFRYLGFSGGGFDEIRLRDGNPRFFTDFMDGTPNALSLDAIELAGTTPSVPVPGPLGLMGLAGLAALAARRKRLPR